MVMALVIWTLGLLRAFFLMKGTAGRWETMAPPDKQGVLSHFVALFGLFLVTWFGFVAIQAFATSEVQAFQLAVLDRLRLGETWIARMVKSRFSFLALRTGAVFGMCVTPFLFFGWLKFAMIVWSGNYETH
jgi:hypothetical protein